MACPSCVLPCGSGVNTSGNQGVYELSFSAGADLGCTIIYFEPFGIPDGIRALWNGNTYNELTGGDGYKASTASPDHYTFIGNSNDDCGIATQDKITDLENLVGCKWSIWNNCFTVFGRWRRAWSEEQ